MRVGVPKETWPGETRVSLIPSAVAALVKSGLEVIVEERAGTAAGFPDAAYRDQGASIGGHADVFSTADILLQVRSVPPEAPTPGAASQRSAIRSTPQAGLKAPARN